MYLHQACSVCVWYSVSCHSHCHVTTVITTIVITTILGYGHNVFITVVPKTVTNSAQGHCTEGTLIWCLHFGVRWFPMSSVVTLATNHFPSFSLYEYVMTDCLHCDGGLWNCFSTTSFAFSACETAPNLFSNVGPNNRRSYPFLGDGSCGKLSQVMNAWTRHRLTSEWNVYLHHFLLACPTG